MTCAFPKIQLGGELVTSSMDVDGAGGRVQWWSPVPGGSQSIREVRS